MYSEFEKHHSRGSPRGRGELGLGFGQTVLLSGTVSVIMGELRELNQELPSSLSKKTDVRQRNGPGRTTLSP